MRIGLMIALQPKKKNEMKTYEIQRYAFSTVHATSLQEYP